MKKILFICGVAIIIVLNLYTTKSSNSFNESFPKIQMFESANADIGASNCWSQYEYEEGSGVLKCVVCEWQDDATGKGRHDGTCD